DLLSVGLLAQPYNRIAFRTSGKRGERTDGRPPLPAVPPEAGGLEDGPLRLLRRDLPGRPQGGPRSAFRPAVGRAPGPPDGPLEEARAHEGRADRGAQEVSFTLGHARNRVDPDLRRHLLPAVHDGPPDLPRARVDRPARRRRLRRLPRLGVRQGR